MLHQAHGFLQGGHIPGIRVDVEGEMEGLVQQLVLQHAVHFLEGEK